MPEVAHDRPRLRRALAAAVRLPPRDSRALLPFPRSSLDAPDALELLVGYCARGTRARRPAWSGYASEADAAARSRAGGGSIRAVAFTDAEYPASLRANSAGARSCCGWPAGCRAQRPGGGHRRIPRGVAPAASRWPSGSGTIWPPRASRWSAGSRGAATRRRTGARSPRAGLTVAVLGCGADVVYPAEHRGLYQRIRDDAARSSRSCRPARRRCPAHFPQRNRIISGLVAGGRGRRGDGAERLAHHGGLCARAGPRRDGGTRQHPRQPSPRAVTRCCATARDSSKTRATCSRSSGLAGPARGRERPTALPAWPGDGDRLPAERCWRARKGDGDLEWLRTCRAPARVRVRC